MVATLGRDIEGIAIEIRERKLRDYLGRTNEILVCVVQGDRPEAIEKLKELIEKLKGAVRK